MVVDDSATMRQFILLTLKKLGCTSMVDAPNGQVALEKLASHSVDIVLTDLDMPVMNGFEFIEKARERDMTLPIVILSTHDDEATREKGLMLGANDCLTKPLSGAKLTEALEKIFPDFHL
jgi:two-component system, chemotaxis family, chemotaxis protein CheY